MVPLIPLALLATAAIAVPTPSLEEPIACLPTDALHHPFRLCPWKLDSIIYQPLASPPLAHLPKCPENLHHEFGLCPWTDANGIRHRPYLTLDPCPAPKDLHHGDALCSWSVDGGKTVNDPVPRVITKFVPTLKCGEPKVFEGGRWEVEDLCPYFDTEGVLHKPYFVNPDTFDQPSSLSLGLLAVLQLPSRFRPLRQVLAAMALRPTKPHRASHREFNGPLIPHRSRRDEGTGGNLRCAKWGVHPQRRHPRLGRSHTLSLSKPDLSHSVPGHLPQFLADWEKLHAARTLPLCSNQLVDHGSPKERESPTIDRVDELNKKNAGFVGEERERKVGSWGVGEDVKSSVSTSDLLDLAVHVPERVCQAQVGEGTVREARQAGRPAFIADFSVPLPIADAAPAPHHHHSHNPSPRTFSIMQSLISVVILASAALAAPTPFKGIGEMPIECPSSADLHHPLLLCPWSLGSVIYEPVDTRLPFGLPKCEPNLDHASNLCPWTDAQGVKHHPYVAPLLCSPAADIDHREGLCSWSTDGGKTVFDPLPRVHHPFDVGPGPLCRPVVTVKDADTLRWKATDECPFRDEEGVVHHPIFVDPTTLQFSVNAARISSHSTSKDEEKPSRRLKNRPPIPLLESFMTKINTPVHHATGPALNKWTPNRALRTLPASTSRSVFWSDWMMQDLRALMEEAELGRGVR
ncbi:hypothetical protein BDK51DRAFT_45251 [Blyttiomyces helicus]|uniref:Uncharacterized protein n=1 Tax=Blyttiomyces helicus TaxID=388810 RepID=A0A4P9WFS3_9FUNG|nr:hypothetical protein BDK51DRAFT_45251 [Blyttiomyces helicus]|eukprot:RKO89286.1 hypothetical protein BDK51DRAFT_45251 [Blyttiomyces helicus]